jgi:hypothetical protein
VPASEPGPAELTTRRAALVALAAALDPRDFSVTLTVPPGRPARLAVTSRHAAIGDDIYADHQSFYWSWSERIGPISDPQAAARKISSVLRTTPQPTYG